MGTLDIVIIGFSILLALIGLVPRKYPKLISGYNTMPAEKRKNVDIDAVGRLLFKGFLLIGVATLVLYFTLKLFGVSGEIAFPIGLFAPVFLGMIVLPLLSQKYDKNPRRKFVKYLPSGVLALIGVVVAIMVPLDARPTKAVVGEDAVEFTGSYGLTVPLAEIACCELWDDLPRIEARTNGLGLGPICKGYFRLEGLGACRLFIKHGEVPYLYMETIKGEKIIFNSPEKGVAERLYSALSER